MTEVAATIGRASRRAGELGWGAFARRAVTIAARPALAPLAAARLRTLAERAPDTAALVDLAFTFDAFGIQIRPGQVPAEIVSLLVLLQEQPPRRILEIGTNAGGSLFLFSQVAADDALIVSVDLPHGEFGGGYPPWRGRLYRHARRRGQRMELLRADSHADATFARVSDLLGGKPLDFLFIDGDHTYEGVRADFERYRTLVRPGGLIGVHDIAPGRAGGARRREVQEANLLGGEVPRFWAEIRERYPTTQFEESGLGFYGIGVVRVVGEERGRQPRTAEANRRAR